MLLQGLGAVGDVAPSHVPWLLRLAHIQYVWWWVGHH